jgi:fatty acid amide hydrolase 2
MGCEVSTARFPLLRSSFDIWSSMLARAEGRSSFRALLQRPTLRSLLWQLLLWAFGASPHTIPAIGLGIFENLAHLLPNRTKRFVERGRELKAQLTEALGDDGVMLYPSYPLPAPRHYFPLFPPFSWVYTAILNVMELPSTQVPLGLDARGVPLGVQVVAGPGRDHLSIAVALSLERAFGGWVPPPGMLASRG